MGLQTFSPDPDDAQGLERAFPDALEEDFDAHNEAFATAKFIYKPMADDLLALKRDSVSDLGYGKEYTCGAGDAVGDPVRISADDTVTLAKADTLAHSEVFAFIAHKGPLGAASDSGATTCRLKHFMLVTGLSGLTANALVYLTDAGAYSATPGTIIKIVGLAINTTDAIVFANPIEARRDTQLNFGLKGADVASAATIAATGNVFHVTGTTTITSVSGTGIRPGTQITIIFDGALTFTDGSNLKLSGDFVTTADDTITLVFDGTNWYEVARSVN